MWVKRTPEELARMETQRRRKRVQWACVAAVIALLAVTFTQSRWRSQRQLWLVSSEDIPGHLVFAIPISLLMGVFGYWLDLGRSRRTVMVCPKCEATKHADTERVCPCGGTFEDMETMKWA